MSQDRRAEMAALERVIAEQKRLIDALRESDSLLPEWQEKQIDREEKKMKEAEDTLAKLRQESANDDGVAGPAEIAN